MHASMNISQVSIRLWGILLLLFNILSLSHVWLFCNPMDCSLPGSSVHGVSQTRLLEWILVNSEDLPNLRIKSASPALAGTVFTTEPPGKPIGGYSLLLIRYCLKSKKYAISTYHHYKLLPTLTVRSKSQSPNKISKVSLTLPIVSCPLLLTLCPYVCSLHLHLYCCSANRLTCTIFLDSIHMYLIYDICFSFPDLLHSLWQTLGPSTSLQMAQFLSFYVWVLFHYIYIPHLQIHFAI